MSRESSTPCELLSVPTSWLRDKTDYLATGSINFVRALAPCFVRVVMILQRALQWQEEIE